ncbi:hypothetical protein T492DRAFT_833271 [Pavlovales sp. CCMP2436]|nr:hypothetical protein T492DRAFT_833271 [Pavlovales sp. CCMP2436]
MTFELPCDRYISRKQAAEFYFCKYNLLQQVLTDFSCGCDDYKTSGTMRGVADYVPTAIATPANFTNAYYARLGATIVPGGSLKTSTSVAAGSNYVGMPIAVRTKSATAIFVAIRKTANLGAFGSTIIPSSYVTAGAESRMELMRALGMQLSESTARTCSFPMTEAIGDGLLVDSTIILDMNLGTAQTSAIRLDAFVQMEKVLVFANGAISFDA